MTFNSSDYFAYKKNKMHIQANGEKKPISKLSFIFQLFVATFIIMFIIIVIAIMKYSSKMDIEYSKGDFSFKNVENPATSANYGVDFDDEQKKIDKRLRYIQQEDNAPSEAKIVTKPKNEEVIDPVHIKQNKKIEKIEKIKAKNEQSEKENKKNKRKEDKLEIVETAQDVKKHNSEQKENKKRKQEIYDDNVIITSKVLIGRFSTLDDAQEFQNEIKAKNPNLMPYARKIGDVYTVQLGSYNDFYAAKTQAQKLKSLGFDVWIYQQ